MLLRQGVTAEVVTTAVALPVKRRGESGVWWSGRARRRFLSSIYSSMSWSSFTSMSSTCKEEWRNITMMMTTRRKTMMTTDNKC